jgi:hypothetical protein
MNPCYGGQEEAQVGGMRGQTKEKHNSEIQSSKCHLFGVTFCLLVRVGRKFVVYEPAFFHHKWQICLGEILLFCVKIVEILNQDSSIVECDCTEVERKMININGILLL